MVLLTLLSIVQALALELLWSHVRESAYLFDMSLAALITWIQVATNFMGIIVIWIVYASTAMRFRWVPTTSDSVYPFVIGLLEFILIEALAPEYLGWWFICLAMIFGLMTWVSQMTMRRARLDGENEEFFVNLEPATASDFYPAFAIIFGAIVAGIYLAVSGDRGFLALFAVAAAFAVLVRQLIVATRFWELSVTDTE
jgi:hypothetical protein